MDGRFLWYLVKWRFSDVLPMLKCETPSWFYREKQVDYGICVVSVCAWTPPRGMLLFYMRPFHYQDSSMYVAVGDINYIAESVVRGKSKRILLILILLQLGYLFSSQLYTPCVTLIEWRFISLTQCSLYYDKIMCFHRKLFFIHPT